MKTREIDFFREMLKEFGIKFECILEDNTDSEIVHLLSPPVGGLAASLLTDRYYRFSATNGKLIGTFWLD